MSLNVNKVVPEAAPPPPLSPSQPGATSAVDAHSHAESAIGSVSSQPPRANFHPQQTTRSIDRTKMNVRRGSNRLKQLFDPKPEADLDLDRFYQTRLRRRTQLQDEIASTLVSGGMSSDDAVLEELADSPSMMRGIRITLSPGEEYEKYQKVSAATIKHSADSYFDTLVDIFFFADVAMTFNTAVDVDGTIRYNRRLAATNYLNSWFAVDVVAALPYGHMFPTDGSASSSSVYKSLKLLRLVRLLRLFRISRILRRIQNAVFIRSMLSSLLKYCMLVTFVSHWFSCIFHGIGAARDDGTNWIRTQGLDDPHAGEAQQLLAPRLEPKQHRHLDRDGVSINDITLLLEVAMHRQDLLINRVVHLKNDLDQMKLPHPSSSPRDSIDTRGPTPVPAPGALF